MLRRAWRAAGGIGLANWIWIAMLAGVALGLLWPEGAGRLSVVSNIFLRLIRTIIAPMLFGLLVTAVAGAGGIRDMGRVGLKAVVYFEIITTLALLTGYASVFVFRPGAGVVLTGAAVETAQAPGLAAALEQAFPSSLMDALARGDVLQIVVFCFLFGAAASAVGAKAAPVVRFSESLAAVAFQYTRYVMYLAPLGVGAAMASTVGEKGFGVLFGLGKLVGAAYAAQLFFGVVVFGGLLAACGVPFRRFAAAAREPILIAFATTSSAAALPRALEEMEWFGVPKKILALVMPLGLSFNMVGSSLHLAQGAFFVAQAAEVPLTMGQHLLILLTLKLASKGVAGVPRANFVILSALFPSFGLPPEGLGMLLGIDAVIDMVRTSVNTLGHCVGPVVVAWWEGTRFTANQAD